LVFVAGRSGEGPTGKSVAGLTPVGTSSGSGRVAASAHPREGAVAPAAAL